jgi:hypothetical protein
MIVDALAAKAVRSWLRRLNERLSLPYLCKNLRLLLMNNPILLASDRMMGINIYLRVSVYVP